MDIHAMTKQELAELIETNRAKPEPALLAAANRVKEEYYGKKVYIRGLIEISNYCKNNCYYCGIRAGNRKVSRYRLSPEEILSCCEIGAALGFRTYVLQGGEDPGFSDRMVCDLVEQIKIRWPDTAVTLSLGEKSREVYQAYRDAGADRYLLRHEAADQEFYKKLHPAALSLDNRKKCLYTLKKLGFQTGAGFMVGAPGQTAEHLAADLLFLKDLQPDMVGIGPFIPQKDSVFARERAGTLEETLTMLALTRLLLPAVLLPATTALGTIHPTGREQGLLAGGNVVMPNLSPAENRKNYALYDNKLATGAESAQGLADLRKKLEAAGLEMDMGRGDRRNFR